MENVFGDVPGGVGDPLQLLAGRRPDARLQVIARIPEQAILGLRRLKQTAQRRSDSKASRGEKQRVLPAQVMDLALEPLAEAGRPMVRAEASVRRGSGA
jgi:hypothetical protein